MAGILGREKFFSLLHILLDALEQETELLFALISLLRDVNYCDYAPLSS